jgi:hypothetical protein
VGSSNDDSDDPFRPQDPERLVQYYLRKAEECLHFAATVAERESRDEWLRLAKNWSQLAQAAKPRN